MVKLNFGNNIVFRGFKKDRQIVLRIITVQVSTKRAKRDKLLSLNRTIFSSYDAQSSLDCVLLLVGMKIF